MKKKVFIAILMVLLSLALFSCGGGGGVGGGAEVFKTVTLTAVSSANIFDSDVAIHSAGCGVAGDTTSVAPDDVDVQFISTINPGLPSDITGSSVRLNGVIVKYKPVSANAPKIADHGYALSAIVPANSESLTVPIRIANQAMKINSTLSALECTNTIYTYFVTLVFSGVEIDTDKEATFETNLTINFADFVDQ
jgi:hypothetical protein